MAHEKVTQGKYFAHIVKGSFHQGNTSIFSSKSVGKQCVPNCAIAGIIYINCAIVQVDK